MDLGLNGRVAAVAAASRGLGFAVARELCAEGADVAICGRSIQPLTKAADRLSTEYGRRVLPVVADVSDALDATRFIESCAGEFGRLDILVTNAGGPPPGEFLNLTAADWQRSVDLTLMSAANLCRAAIPHLRRSENARIIAIASFSVKQPLRDLTLSNSVRLAVVGLMKSLSIELAPLGILVNTVLPGWTLTERVDELVNSRARTRGVPPQQVMDEIVNAIPLRRMADPAEFASVVAFLASSRASYLTGAAIQIDGGASKSPV